MPALVNNYRKPIYRGFVVLKSDMAEKNRTASSTNKFLWRPIRNNFSMRFLYAACKPELENEKFILICSKKKFPAHFQFSAAEQGDQIGRFFA
jgi:hypothetical protein